MSEAMRQEAIRLAEEQAFDVGRDCDHCGGSGKVNGGDRVIHSVSPSGFGADWNVESVVEAIRTAEDVLWTESRFVTAHELHLKRDDGKWWLFGVKRPACPQCERIGGTPGCIDCDPVLARERDAEKGD
jgi:hypothetical protein